MMFKTVGRRFACVAKIGRNVSRDLTEQCVSTLSGGYRIVNYRHPIVRNFAANSLLNNGKKSEAYVRTYEPYGVSLYARPSLVLVKGEGSKVTDLDGKTYLDFTAGIAVNGLGHGNKEVARILFEQSQKAIHISNLYYNEHAGPLAKLIVDRTKENGAMAQAAKVFFSNSGTEANEAAIKFARKYGKVSKRGSEKKYEIVSFARSFHGRTMGSLSATPNEKYQKPYFPMIPGFKYGIYNDLDGIESIITENTCGVIIEPIQGEGGVYQADPEFMVALRKRCNEVDALLIYDEIQSGIGRTGNLWAHQMFPADAHPDILTMAKTLGNGFPIGAVLTTEKVASVIKFGDHGTTFGGNPLACCVAYYVFDQLSRPELLASVVEKGQLLKSLLLQLKEKFPKLISEIRGTGLILGIQFTEDPSPVISKALEEGLLIITAGTNTIRLLPPLVITEDEIMEGVSKIEKAISSTMNV
ncbi:pyridoxal phosphate-dependent transferase [Dipodascopsis uninucleata]